MNNTAIMAQVMPVIKKTPVKLSTVKTGLNIIGGKNWPMKRKVVRYDTILPRAQVFVSSPTQRFRVGITIP